MGKEVKTYEKIFWKVYQRWVGIR